MKTSFSINIRTWAALFLFAYIPFFYSGCQPTENLTILSPTLAPTPTPLIFPLPRAIPISAFQHPMVEDVEAKQLNGKGWTSYIPQGWSKQFQQTGEYPIVSSIIETVNGTLWFATRGVGAYRFDGKTWTHFTMENGLPFDEISSMTVAPDDAIWFGAINHASRFDGKTWTSYVTENGLANGDDIRAITFSTDGALWMGTGSHGVSRFDGRGWQNYMLQDSSQENLVTPIFILPDNTLLFSSSIGSSAKLIHYDGQRWTNFPTPWTDQGKYTVDMATTSNGDLWFATEFSGVYRFSENTWTNYTTKDGLVSNEIHSVAVAKDGSVWVGTASGVSRFDGKKWGTYVLENDTGNKWIGSILAANDGSVWLAYAGGIAHFISSNIP